MPAPTRLVVRFTPFPPGFVGDLSKFCQAFIDRIEVLSPFAGLQWQIGGIKPTSNVGPWLNDLGQPFTWDETLKDYVPMDISLSLGTFESDFAALQAEVDALPTVSEMNAAIAAAVGGVAIPSVESYPASADAGPSYNQIVPVDTVDHKLNLNQADINVGGKFDESLSRYVAPVHGIYRFSIYCQVDNSSADMPNLESFITLFVNGQPTRSSGFSSPSSGSRQWPQVSGLIQLGVNDQAEAWGRCQDGTNTGSVTFTDTVFSIELVRAL